MRKVILPLVIALALVASVAGANYVAQVDMEADPNVVGTQAAELAFSFNTSDPVANDVLSWDYGSPRVIEADFGDVQRNSEYDYYWAMQVTNNKPYDVCLMVKDVTGNLGASGDDFELRIWANETDRAEFKYCSAGGEYSELWRDFERRASAEWCPCYCLPAGKSCWISFVVETLNNPTHTNYSGTITFKAVSDEDFSCDDQQGGMSCEECHIVE